MTHTKQMKQLQIAIIISLLSLITNSSTYLLFSQPCFATEKTDIKRGEKVFNALQCVMCHANLGNNINPERPLKGAGFLKRYPDNKSLIQIIRKGANEKGMPSFDTDQLSDTDMNHLIAYIRSATKAINTTETINKTKTNNTAKKVNSPKIIKSGHAK